MDTQKDHPFKALGTILTMVALGLLLLANSLTAPAGLDIADTILGAFFLFVAAFEALFNKEEY